jgi:reactive intermediate/imine deaminase
LQGGVRRGRARPSPYDQLMIADAEYYNAESVRTPPGYSHAVAAAGLIFVAGQVPLDSEGMLVGAGDMAEQTRQVFRNLRTVLAMAGADLTDVVKLGYFIRDMDAIGAMRAARDEFMAGVTPPASTLVEVSRLFRPDILIEIEAVALAPRAPATGADRH